MYVVAFDRIKVKVAIEGEKVFTNLALFIQELNLFLEVKSADSLFANCVALGGTNGIKVGMKVINTNKPFTVKFSKKLVGRVLDSSLNIIAGEKSVDINDDYNEIITYNNNSYNIADVSGSINIQETGIKSIDFFSPYLVGGKIGVIGGAGVGKTTMIMEIIRNMRSKKVFTIFAGIGERIREGHAFYNEMIEFGLIDPNKPEESGIVIVFGNMDQPPSIREKTALTSVAIAEYIRDVESTDVLLLMDNVFRFAQAANEISSSLKQIPSELGYQPDINFSMSRLQERICSIQGKKSITSIQAIYVPADDKYDPAVTACDKHTDATILLSREYASKGIYPAIDPLSSSSTALTKHIVGERHFNVYKEVKRILTRNKELETIISMVGIENLTEEDRIIVKKSNLIFNFLTQPFFTAESFTGISGEYVKVEDTITGFERIVSGELNNIDPAKLYLLGKMP